MIKYRPWNKNYILPGFLWALFIGGFFIDVFSIQPADNYTDWSGDIRLFLFVGLWLIVGRCCRYTSFTTLKLALIFVSIFSYLFLFSRNSFSTERITSWIYIYLAIGVLQQLWEARNSSRGKNEG